MKLRKAWPNGRHSYLIIIIITIFLFLLFLFFLLLPLLLVSNMSLVPNGRRLSPRAWASRTSSWEAGTRSCRSAQDICISLSLSIYIYIYTIYIYISYHICICVVEHARVGIPSFYSLALIFSLLAFTNNSSSISVLPFSYQGGCCGPLFQRCTRRPEKDRRACKGIVYLCFDAETSIHKTSRL